MKLVICGWDKINGRKDIINATWFKFKHSFFEDPDFYDFTHQELLVWLYILCLASKTSSNTITINFSHADRVGRLDKASIESAVTKLKSIGVVSSKDDGAMAIIEEGKKRTKARQALKNSIRQKKITRPTKCEKCGRENTPIDAHHIDYEKPLLVEWLCKKCHGQGHVGMTRLTEFARAATEREPNVTEREPNARLEEIRLEEIKYLSPEQSESDLLAVSNDGTLNKIFSDRKVKQKQWDSWLEAYPDIGWLKQEILKSIAWEIANPKNRKKNFPRFVANWLSGGWDRRPRIADHTGPPPVTPVEKCTQCDKGLIRARYRSSGASENCSCSCIAGRKYSTYIKFDDNRFERIST